MPFHQGTMMSNKPHLRPHQNKRHASQATRLLVAILVLAVFALVIALEMTGHVVFRGRLILLRGGRWLLIWGPLACELAELASFFGQVNGLMFPLIEALGVGPVNVSAVEGGQGGFLGTCPRDTSFYWGLWNANNTARLDRTATEDWKCLCVVAVAGRLPGPVRANADPYVFRRGCADPASRRCARRGWHWRLARSASPRLLPR
jgi:hypothetical protein